jgi:acetyl-CoA C-acetyltransferase
VETKTVYIQCGLRSPIGKTRGELKRVRPEFIGAQLLNALKNEKGVDRPDLFLCGNVVGTGGNIGRLAALYSDYDETMPAVTTDMQCASAGASIALGASLIKSGEAHTIIAGGMESSSLQPERIYAPGDDREGSYKTAQFSPSENDEKAMLKGSERTIEKYHVTEDDMIPLIIRSHQNAAKAREKGKLSSIIHSIKDKKTGTVITEDECIRPRMNDALLKRMPPLLGPGTFVNAGNTCFTNDGGAFVVLTDQPSPFRIAASSFWAGAPLTSPEGAWKASEKVLHKAHMTMDDMDVIEWNEAFAVIDVLFKRAYPEALPKYLAWGGALAYGHPYGASGAIILLHAIERLKDNGGRYGLCAIAGAGGTGTAMIIEHV